MKHTFKTSLFSLLILLFAAQNTRCNNRLQYDEFFTNDRLRIDLIFAGDYSEQMVFLSGVKKEGAWSGSRRNLVDHFRYGEYYMELYSGDQLIYSKGFCSLFQEWRTTDEAKRTKKAFTLSQTIPYPKKSVTLSIYERCKKTGSFIELESFSIDPNHKSVNCEKENDFTVRSLHNSGDPSEKVDLLFIAEGYTEDQMDKFISDAQRFTQYLFDIEPYKSRKQDFNIWAVESISKDSGPDIPQNDQWSNSVAGATFYTFDVDRYMTAPDHTQISKIASNAHYDIIYVIVNTDKYGGGGIYNFYGLSMSDGRSVAEVFVHELAHTITGLADEYYTSEVAYEDYYNLRLEPWEPNITTLVNFDKKWKNMLSNKTPVPTPDVIEYENTLGVFEGGGYMAKGIYRPVHNCRMKANNAPAFCPVCQKAINDMIDYYCK